MNQLQFIKRVIYSLKREYGLPLELYTITSITVNLETGVQQLQKQVYKIRQAILLPRKLTNDIVSLLGGTRKFHYGDLIDKEKRTVLIDSKDYPKDYEIRPGDYALMDHNRFNIVEANPYDNKLAVEMTMTKIIGEQPAAIIEQSLSTNLDISQELTNG